MHPSLCAKFLIASVVLCAAAYGETAGLALDGGAGVTETLAQIMAREAARPKDAKPRVLPPRRRRPPIATNSLSAPAAPAEFGAAERSASAVAPRGVQSVGTSFLGVDETISQVSPPDSMGAVGPTQIFVCVNNRFRLFDRAGNLQSSLDVSSDAFFASVLGGSTSADPRVRYDRLSQRWYVTMIDFLNHFMLAVSSGPTLTDTTTFTFYRFAVDAGLSAGAPDFGGSPDYDTLGVDVNALYIGCSVFDQNSNLIGASVFIVNKTSLLGGTLAYTAFHDVSLYPNSGIYTPQAVDNDDPAATQGYFIGVDNTLTNRLVLLRVSNPGASPTISGSIAITVPDYGAYSLTTVPALGSTAPLDDNDTRLFQAMMRNGSLYTAHNILVNSSGVANALGDRDGARWYEIINLSGTPRLHQSGTVFDSAAANPRNYFFPSCIGTGQGHMALSSSVAGNNEHAEVAATGRLAGDALGTMQTPFIVVSSSSTYNYEPNFQRWGDYSATVLDPNDYMTVWTFQEYCSATDVWGVRVIQLKAPPPATPSALSQTSVPATGSNLVITLTGTSVNGSGFYDPGTGFLNHLAASVSGGGVTVNSVTYVDPIHLTLNLSTNSAAPGPRSITIVNPDGQSVTSKASFLCVALPGSASLTAVNVAGPAVVDQGIPFPLGVSMRD